MDPGAIFTVPEAYAASESWRAVAARLRREQPVFRVEAADFDPFYALTEHADVSRSSASPSTCRFATDRAEARRRDPWSSCIT